MKNYLILFLCYAAMLLIAGPFHDFPLNDDWTYSASAKHFAETGQYISGPIPAMTLFGHVLWGSLFIKIFGFSFSVLSFSVMVMAFAGIVFTYKTVLLISGNSFMSLLAALLVMANPVFFSLSVSFMTDVPFYAVTLISLYYLLRFEKNSQWKFLLTAILFSVWGVLIRQTGLVLPLCFSCWYFISQFKSRNKWIPALLPAVSVTLILFLFLKWIERLHQVPDTFQGQNQVLSYLQRPTICMWYMMSRGSIALFFGGLFLFPYLMLSSVSFFKSFRRFEIILSVLILLLLVYPFSKYIGNFPFGNIFSKYGIGPLTFSQALAFQPLLFPDLPFTVIFILRAFALGGAIMLVLRLLIFLLRFFREKNYQDSFSILFPLSAIILFLVLISLPEFFFDRYLLFFLPFFLLIIPPPEKAFNLKTKALALSFCMAILFFSALMTRDYFARNGAVWNSAVLLEKAGVAPDDIEAGYEYNGWHAYTGHKLWERDAGWYSEKRKFAISFGPIEGYAKIGELTYQAYLPRQKRKVLILRQNQ